MSKRNVKKVKIVIPNATTLQLINNTFALKRLSRLQLTVGENIEYVNHAQYAHAKNMFKTINVEYVEIK